MPKGAKSITPTSLSFSSPEVGKSSEAQTVILTNIGDATLNIYCIETPAGPSNCYTMHAYSDSYYADFSETTTCTFNDRLPYPPINAPLPQGVLGARYNLGVGDSCTINVVFTPQLSGERKGVLIIDTDASNGSSDRIPLNGNSTSIPSTTKVLLSKDDGRTKYSYYLDSSGQEVLDGVKQYFDSQGGLGQSWTYVDGKQTGPYKEYCYDVDHIYRTSYIAYEGSYLNNSETGIWKYNFCPDRWDTVSSGKLRIERTYGGEVDYAGIPLTYTDKGYCSYTTLHPGEVSGTSSYKFTATGAYVMTSQQTFLKDGCYSP